MYVNGIWVNRVLLTEEEKKARKLENNKRYALEHPNYFKMKSREAYAKHTDYSRAKSKENYARCLKDPDKLKRLKRQRRAWYFRNKVRLKLQNRARAAVQYAIKTGVLIRPDICEKCGKPNPHGHHVNGYEKEYQLDVEWLCRDCHGKVTRKYK